MIDINPLFIATAGALAGGLVKFFYDNWSGSIAWKREFQTRTSNKVENQATAYRKMSNYAQLLSDNLNRHNTIKSNLQIMSIVPGQSVKCIRFNPCYASMYKESVEIAKVSLFNAGKFLRILSDSFLNKGLDYFLPDWWAGQSLEDFQYALTEIFPFDSFTLLKYIDEEIELHKFKEKIESPECSDLKRLFEIYKNWLFNEDVGVSKLSDYANAYDNLFDQQLDLFNKDWYEKADGWRQIFTFRRKVQKYDSDKVRGDETDFAKLRPETDELIKIFEESRIRTREEVKKLRLMELSDDIKLGSLNSLITTGWGHYCREEYKLAILAYNKAECILNSWYVEDEKKREDVFNRKMSIVNNNKGNIYANLGIIDKDNHNFEKAEENFKLADSEYKKSIKYYNKECENEEDCEFNHDVYYVNYAILCLNRGENYAGNKPIATSYNDSEKSIKALKYYDNSIKLLKKAIEFKEKFLDLRSISNKFKDISYYFHLMGYVQCFKVDLLKKMDKQELEKDLDKAITNFMLAISLNPTEHIFYINLAHLYYKNGKNKLGTYYQCKGIRMALGHVNENVQDEYSKDLEKIFKEIKDSEDKYYEECKIVHEELKGSCQM